MENIRIRFCILMLAMVFSAQVFYGQNEKQLQEAFSQSYSHETSGDYAKSIDVLRRIYNEDHYAINLRLGWLSYMNGAFTESAAYYNKAIQIMPLSIEARLGFALPASAMGNWDHVVARYKEILRIDPNHYLTNYRMGNIYYFREDYKSAFSHFERIANLYPFDYDAIHMFAWTNLRLGKFTEAKVLFNKALLIRPDDDSSKEGLGLIN